MRQVGAAGNGVIVLLRPPHRNALSRKLTAQEGDKVPTADLRDYGIGAQILLDLGVKDMTLLSNSQRQVVGLEGYGLNIVGYEPITLEK